ncbi:22741_t:CDS:2 [Cetraspora pellucida]|uniref:22741_t:CDS:1 n=1 Tax=Cetraspora pellucida TaxID=1433469 RepID=A0A9N8VR32_9GLOM|nr:22741_t:CDS:2 [Cetraspora pellucida]
MISSNTLLFNKKNSVYYREKHHSLSLPSPPPSPHESALKGLFGISEVLSKFDSINNTLLNSQQNETENTFFPSIKCLLDAPINDLDNIRKTKSINKTTPSHCLSRFSLSNAKSSPLKTSHTMTELIFNDNNSSYYTNQDKNNIITCRTSVNRQYNIFRNIYPPQTSSIGSSLITPKIDDPINSPKFSFMQSQPVLEPESYEQQRQRSIQIKRSGTSAPQRKRKGNSLARVMADQGLLESVFNTNITSNDIKSVRIPPPLPMQFDELISNINALELDTDALEKISPEISWKGQPLSIAHLPHYNALHPTEAHIVSILRLTPIQYLTGKHTLISAAHRYAQKALPFKKSDAQKLLRIDVNKASKLWEFFHQVHWI